MGGLRPRELEPHKSNLGDRFLSNILTFLKKYNIGTLWTFQIFIYVHSTNAQYNNEVKKKKKNICKFIKKIRFKIDKIIKNNTFELKKTNYNLKNNIVKFF